MAARTLSLIHLVKRSNSFSRSTPSALPIATSASLSLLISPLIAFLANSRASRAFSLAHSMASLTRRRASSRTRLTAFFDAVVESLGFTGQPTEYAAGFFFPFPLFLRRFSFSCQTRLVGFLVAYSDMLFCCLLTFLAAVVDLFEIAFEPTVGRFPSVTHELFLLARPLFAFFSDGGLGRFAGLMTVA